MSRIGLTQVDQLPETIQDFMQRRGPLNVFRLLANAPDVFLGWARMVDDMLSSATFSARMRELITVRVAYLQTSRYELNQHVPLAHSAGLTAHQIDAIIDAGPRDAARFTAAEEAVLDLITESTELRDRLERHTKRFRAAMTEAGFDIKPGEHPIVPIMLYEEKLAHDFARRLLDEGIYVIGFSYPVVAKGQARIRVQLSAAHTDEHVDRAVTAFAKVGKDLGVLAGR